MNTEIYELVQMDNTVYFAWRLRSLIDGQYRYLLVFTNEMPFQIGLSGIFKFDYLNIDMNNIDWAAINAQNPTNISMAIDAIVNFLNINA